MKERTFSLVKANLLSVPFSLLVIGIIFSFYFLLLGNNKEEMDRLNGFIVLGSFVVCIFIHELIHGLFFAKYTKGGFKNIRFGIHWKALTPYCHCEEAIQVRHYRIAILMPTVLLGFAPLVIGFLFKEINVVGISALMIIGGIGDFIALWILKDFKKETIVLDHPSKMGFLYDE